MPTVVRGMMQSNMKLKNVEIRMGKHCNEAFIGIILHFYILNSTSKMRCWYAGTTRG